MAKARANKSTAIAEVAKRVLATKAQVSDVRATSIRELLASLRKRSGDLAGTFWDVGRDLLALKELRPEKVLVGYSSFLQVCHGECGFSPSFVNEAMDVGANLSREQAILLGTQKRAAAFLALARATPEDDTAVELFQQGLQRKDAYVPPRASARQAEEAAKIIRQAEQAKLPAKKRSGRTTTPAERKLAEDVAKGLAKAGFQVEVRAVAGPPGKPCSYALRHLPREAMPALRKLLPEK